MFELTCVCVLARVCSCLQMLRKGVGFMMHRELAKGIMAHKTVRTMDQKTRAIL